MAEMLVIDPTVEDADNVPLDLLAAPWSVTKLETPAPPLRPTWAEPADADGELLAAARYSNRTITITLEMVPDPANKDAHGMAALQALGAKVAKINREGGTLRRVTAGDEAITFDLLTAEGFEPEWTIEWETARAVTEGITLKLTAAPFGRGDEVAYDEHSETELPAITFTENGPAGDVPALGRLRVTNDATVPQRRLEWGLQLRNGETDEGLVFDATQRELIVGITGTALVSGTFVAVRAFLRPQWAAFMTTNATDGTPLTHVGRFRVLAMACRTFESVSAFDDGRCYLALEWTSDASGGMTRNPPVAVTTAGYGYRWDYVDLGIVDIPPESQSWTGRVIGLGREYVYVAHLVLIPVDRSGTAHAAQPDSLPAGDFAAVGDNRTSGEVGGSDLAIGGKWSGTGSTPDFQYTTGSGGPGGAAGPYAFRTPASDEAPGEGRTVIAPPVLSDRSAVEVDLCIADKTWTAVIARYVDDDTWFGVAYYGGDASIIDRVPAIEIVRDGTTTTLEFATPPPLDTWFTTRVVVRDGCWYVYVGPYGGVPAIVAYGADPELITTYGSGKTGLAQSGETGATSKFANFSSWTAQDDVVAPAGEWAEISSQSALRASDDGEYSLRQAAYEGDYLLVPPAGEGGNKVRVCAATLRQPDGVATVTADPLSAQLFVTPRYLVVPS